MGADAARLTRPGAAPWLAAWLDRLDASLRREAERIRARYELSTGELNGSYVSDARVDAMVAVTPVRAQRHGHAPGPVEPPPPGTPLDDVTREFGLDAAQAVALGVALAPEVDVGYRTIFAHLNDDVTRPLPSVDLCVRLAECDTLLDTRCAALRDGLLDVVPAAVAAHWRSGGLVLAGPVREFLLGVGVPGVPAVDPTGDDDEHTALARAVRDARLRLVVVESPLVADARAAATRVAAAAGRGVVEVGEPPELPDAVLRARLHRACVVLPWFGPATLRPVLDGPAVALVTVRPGDDWQRHLDGVDHAVLTVPVPGPRRRAQLWHGLLRAQQATVDAREVDDVAELFALGPAQIANAAAAAGRDGDRPLAAHARAQCRARLPVLAQPVDLGYRWDDLVLPEATRRRLRELASSIRHRGTVFDGWGFRRPSGGTAAVRALFSGASGTGKTMSAAVVAAELGLPLCRVDLSAVVSKYIGETEKNLEEVFRSVETANALLMFDEADALFGKRSEVGDAHDRYANIEVAYLLQRIETFEGALVLATNLAANLDEAFARRLQVAIEFPLPDAGARERLWRSALPAGAPVGDGIDVASLARAFALSGGEIRNAALGAAFLAVHEREPIGMGHVVRAIARHRLRQGKLPTASEFGEHLHLARAEGA